jgi:O-6-methylguanine DNA methyltransferase
MLLKNKFGLFESNFPCLLLSDFGEVCYFNIGKANNLTQVRLFPCRSEIANIKNMNFKEKVYEFTKKIPKGKVSTYKKVAVAIGSPRASRGVAMVLSKNFDPKIPCHRVVRTDGSLGGYNRGGIIGKAKILKSEGVLIKNGKVDQAELG